MQNTICRRFLSPMPYHHQDAIQKLAHRLLKVSGEEYMEAQWTRSRRLLNVFTCAVMAVAIHEPQLYRHAALQFNSLIVTLYKLVIQTNFYLQVNFVGL